MKKKWKKHLRKELPSVFISIGIAVALFVSMRLPTSFSIETKEPVGDVYVAYPESLKERELYFETLDALGIKEGETYLSLPLSDATRMRYLNSLERATQDTLASSVTEYLPSGSGLTVQVMTPETIHISPIIYKNTLLTAGIIDANVQIAAAEWTMGTNALQGVFLPTVNKQEDFWRIQVAQRELELLNQLVILYPFDEGELKWNMAFLKMKQQVALYNGKASGITIQSIIDNSLPTSYFPLLEDADKESLYLLLCDYQQSSVIHSREVQQAYKDYRQTLRNELYDREEEILKEDSSWNINDLFHYYGWLSE